MLNTQLKLNLFIVVLHNVLRVFFQAVRLICSVEALERIGIVCILVCSLIRNIHGGIKYLILIYNTTCGLANTFFFKLTGFLPYNYLTSKETMFYYLGLSPHDYYTSREDNLHDFSVSVRW